MDPWGVVVAGSYEFGDRIVIKSCLLYMSLQSLTYRYFSLSDLLIGTSSI